MKSFLFVLCSVALAASTPLLRRFKSVDGSTYYIENDQKYNWYQALHECARKNMSLIAIDSFDKHQQVEFLLRTSFPTTANLWIGGHDNAVDNRYQWVSTGEIFSFTNWGPSQPGRSTNQHCIFIETDLAWHDENCAADLNGFICEENPFSKQKTQELELIKKNYENPLNELSKANNFILYMNKK